MNEFDYHVYVWISGDKAATVTECAFESEDMLAIFIAGIKEKTRRLKNWDFQRLNGTFTV